jgi:hypothetical protein
LERNVRTRNAWLAMLFWGGLPRVLLGHTTTESLVEREYRLREYRNINDYIQQTTTIQVAAERYFWGVCRVRLGWDAHAESH